MLLGNRDQSPHFPRGCHIPVNRVYHIEAPFPQRDPDIPGKMGRNWLRPRTAVSIYLAKCGSKSCAHEYNFFTGWVGNLTTQLYSCAQLFGSLFARSMLWAVCDVFTDRTTTNTQTAIACARSTKYKAFSIKSYPFFYPRSQALSKQYWKGWEAGKSPGALCSQHCKCEVIIVVWHAVEYKTCWAGGSL